MVHVVIVRNPFQPVFGGALTLPIEEFQPRYNQSDVLCSHFFQLFHTATATRVPLSFPHLITRKSAQF